MLLKGNVIKLQKHSVCSKLLLNNVEIKFFSELFKVVLLQCISATVRFSIYGAQCFEKNVVTFFRLSFQHQFS